MTENIKKVGVPVYTILGQSFGPEAFRGVSRWVVVPLWCTAVAANDENF
jgi:hypothetical protein